MRRPKQCNQFVILLGSWIMLRLLGRPSCPQYMVKGNAWRDGAVNSTLFFFPKTGHLHKVREGFKSIWKYDGLNSWNSRWCCLPGGMFRSVYCQGVAWWGKYVQVWWVRLPSFWEDINALKWLAILSYNVYCCELWTIKNYCLLRRLRSHARPIRRITVAPSIWNLSCI